MADQASRKGASIPAWQLNYKPGQDATSTSDQIASDPTATHPTTEKPSEPSLLEQAQRFLEEDSIRNASRDKKVALLEEKGLEAVDIEKLLGSEATSSPPPQSEEPPELKTVHDSSQSSSEREEKPQSTPAPANDVPSTAIVAPKREIPPIITYPEFLLKPQKPPPLVTFERLTTAAYVLAGISALTYGASKYIVEPMLHTLTEARHDLAVGTREDLEKLNSKLESVVSHVPYIASSTVLQKKKEQEDDEDLESVDSDPTELFHRDIATQTSPQRSRSNSSSLFRGENPASDPTMRQTTRLKSLHADLSSLLSSTNTHFSQDRLKERMTEFQGVLDKMESSYNPFTADYTFGQHDDKLKNANNKGPNNKDNEVNKFKAEIRGLKGAFLSSRNFPTARPAAPFALPSR